MSRWITRLHDSLGTRRSIMLTIAVYALCRGATIPHDPGRHLIGQSILYIDLPIWLRMAGWIGTSLIAAGCALFSPPFREWIGWLALALMPAERLFSYVVSAVVWLVPGGGVGSAYAAAYALQWFAALVLLAIAATIKEDTASQMLKTIHGKDE